MKPKNYRKLNALVGSTASHHLQYCLHDSPTESCTDLTTVIIKTQVTRAKEFRAVLRFPEFLLTVFALGKAEEVQENKFGPKKEKTMDSR